MPKKLTTQKFIERAKTVHGETYYYNSVEYKTTIEKVKIICKQHGIFKQTPGNHLSGQGCPKCSILIISNKLRKTKETFIKEAKLIHDDKYGYSLVKYVNNNTNVKILCKEHGIFEQTPDNHLRGQGCPKCGKLNMINKKRKTTQEFIKQAKLIHGEEFDYSQVDYTTTSKKIKIQCSIHGIFNQTPKHHLRGHGCHKCNGGCKSNTEEFIEKAKKVHGDNYIYSSAKYINSDTKIKIICKKHGIFEQTPDSHLRGADCPTCNGCYKSNTKEFIEKAKLIHDDKYDYSPVEYETAFKKVKIICKKHGIFEQKPNGHLSGNGCPKCGKGRISKLEIEVQDFIKSLGLKIEDNKSERIKPLELDIYVIDHNIAIEFDGIYYHDENHRDKNFHLMKTLACEKLGIQLIHIFEDEWLYKKEIVKSRLLNLFKLTPNKIFVRKCIIKEVTNKESREFLDNNHIQSNSNSKIRLGLYHNDTLVSLMTFSSLRKNLRGNSKNDYYELGRFCNILNTNVVGGASKLFKYFVNNYQPKQITSYADRRWSQGKLYETLGFDFIHDSAPNYFYVFRQQRKNRFLFRKDILVKEGFDGNKTEHQIMLNRGIFRIYDCGAKKYVMNL